MPFSRRALLQGNWTGRSLAAAAVANDALHHLLQRITWGPRPEELTRAREIGYAPFLEEQLAPQQINDDAAAAQLRNLPLLQMDRQTLYQLRDSDYRSYQALVKGMLLRAVHSKRQLLERMVEFWSDHFNVSADAYPQELILYQREAIRPHALGRFRDLLLATAQSPAMLYYLDNFVNRAGAPNENYARELLELHTLGVDGGYTEADVKEVARAFTGWTVHNGTRTGFYFNPAEHDSGSKQILGRQMPAGRGIEDGLHTLGILAEHPATARFLCGKLCRRFVSDDPPAALVEELTAVWQRTHGNITSVLRTLFLSAEFQQSAGLKFRRPLDFFVGTLRATGTSVGEWWLLEEMLQQLGQPPYGWNPPNGYPDAAGAWMNSSGLLARWQVAMRLTHGAFEDVYGDGGLLQTDLNAGIGQPQTAGALVDAVARRIFGTPLPPPHQAPFIAYLTDGGGGETAVTPHLRARKLASLYGLMLASPQFQWR